MVTGMIISSQVLLLSLQWCLVGIVVPDFEVLIPWAKQNQIPDVQIHFMYANNVSLKICKLFARMIK